MKKLETPNRQRMSSGCVVAVFFAETGFALEPTTNHLVREWHLPFDLACARDMSDLKYVELFKLAV